MLLRNVLAGFLDSLQNERAMDLPFLALLSEMGFEDVHFTHGPAEFGKDFIAKKREGNKLVQFSFQAKFGNVAHGTWRNDVMPQMLEAVVSGLSHPRFDRNLPHQAVLVLTGRLTGNAPVAVQEFNQTVETKYGELPVDIWDRERLLEHFVAHGPDAFYSLTGSGVEGLGAFLTNYGRALRGEFLAPDIERHSRVWFHGPSVSSRPFEGALEAELFATACSNSGRHYEALTCLQAHLRSVLSMLHLLPQDSDERQLRDLYEATLVRIGQLADKHLSSVLEAAAENLFDVVGGAAVLSYPILCARAAESAALLYFVGDEPARERAINALLKLCKEPGLPHPLSDRSAVSIVLTFLALTAMGHQEHARELLRKATVWVADRYQDGVGLAEFDATPTREAEFLVGFPFEGVAVQERNSSFLATALCDLAAFAGDENLYRDVVNEILAVGISFEYFQPRDTPGQFAIDGDDVLQYPNIEFKEELSPFAQTRFANHIANEEPMFRLAQTLGARAYVALMILLRDRYFPSLWPMLVRASAATVTTSAALVSPVATPLPAD